MDQRRRRIKASDFGRRHSPPSSSLFDTLPGAQGRLGREKRELERGFAHIVMEAFHKLSALIDARVFVLIDTGDDRLYTGTKQICEQFEKDKPPPLYNATFIDFEAEPKNRKRRRSQCSCDHAAKSPRPSPGMHAADEEAAKSKSEAKESKEASPVNEDEASKYSDISDSEMDVEMDEEGGKEAQQETTETLKSPRSASRGEATQGEAVGPKVFRVNDCEVLQGRDVEEEQITTHFRTSATDGAEPVSDNEIDFESSFEVDVKKENLGLPSSDEAEDMGAKTKNGATKDHGAKAKKSTTTDGRALHNEDGRAKHGAAKDKSAKAKAKGATAKNSAPKAKGAKAKIRATKDAGAVGDSGTDEGGMVEVNRNKEKATEIKEKKVESAEEAEPCSKTEVSSVICVNNLPRMETPEKESALREQLRNLLGACGSVSDVVLLNDDRPDAGPGRALVTFGLEKDAQNALQYSLEDPLLKNCTLTPVHDISHSKI